MMSSVKLNDETVSMHYIGDHNNSSMQQDYVLKNEDTLTYNPNHLGEKDLLMVMLAKLGLAPPVHTFTALETGTYTVTTSTFGIQAHRVG